MDEIPEDVMRVARRLITEGWAAGSAPAEVVARAILAERKRCAEVAMREGDKTQPAVGYFIATSIEAGA